MSGVDPTIPGNRTRANRIRKLIRAGSAVPDVDRLWLAEYEENQVQKPRRTGAEAAAAATDFGASRSGRRLRVELDEQQEAVGTGGAAAAAALASKEEGRRLDSLTTVSIAALREAVAVYRDVALSLKERLEIIENAHVSMMETMRDSFLSRVETEAELIHLRAAHENAQGGASADSMLIEVLSKHFGLVPTAGGPTHANGHSKKPHG